MRAHRSLTWPKAAAACVLAVGLAGTATLAAAQGATTATTPGSIGLEIASARTAAIDFLAAYASSGADDGRALQDAVTGEPLEEWATWVGVQRSALDGITTGSMDLRGVKLVSIAEPVTGPPVATVEVDASVTIVNEPPVGESTQLTFDFSGPMTMQRDGEGSWQVVDATREGASLAEAMILLTGGATTQRVGGLTVHLESMQMAPQAWLMNIEVVNRSGQPVSLGPPSALLTPVDLSASADAVAAGAVTSNLRRLDDGATQRGIVTFAPQPQLLPEFSFGLLFDSKERSLPIVFPIGLGGPSAGDPSASPAPAPSVSTGPDEPAPAGA